MSHIFDAKIIDQDATIDHVKALAYSRSTSSIGEIEAVLYIQKEMNSKNIESKLEYFSFSGPKRLFMRLSYFIIFSYLLINRLILIIALYFSIKYLFAATRNFSLVEKEDSKNLVAKIPASSDNSKRGVIIFSAHHDNFSANIPYRIQSVFFFLFKIILIPFFLILFALSAWFLIEWISSNPNVELIYDLVITYSLFEFIIVFFILLLIYNTKRSSGSIDNASGVSILIELAKLIKINPLENYDVIFLWCGAEEWGVLGSKAFCKRHYEQLNEEYDLNKSFNINIDMVGTYIGLLDMKRFQEKKYENKVNQTIEDSAKKLNIPLVRYKKRFNPTSDHKSFISLAKKSKSLFQVGFFHSDKDSKYIHSPRDTPDKCSSKNLNGCLEICYQAIKTFDLKF